MRASKLVQLGNLQTKVCDAVVNIHYSLYTVSILVKKTIFTKNTKITKILKNIKQNYFIEYLIETL